MYFYPFRMTNNKYFGSFFLLLLLFLLIPSAQAQEQVKVEDDKIEITQAQDKLGEIDPTTIIITALRENLNGVEARSTDLKNGQNDWIEKSKVKISPQQLDLIRGQPSELNITFQGLDEGPGTYSGNLLLTSPNLITVKVPITITIHANPLIALLLVGAGVIISFVFKFLLLKVNDKEENEKILDNAIKRRLDIMQFKDQLIQLKNELNSLRHLGPINPHSYRGSSTEMLDIALNNAVSDYNNGYFRESIKEVQDSINLFTNVQDPLEPPTNMNIQHRSLRKRGRWLFTQPRRGDYAAYAGVTLALLISVLLVWQIYYPQLFTFGVFPIDYIAAFLFGFGSQAILINEILDFARRIWP